MTIQQQIHSLRNIIANAKVLLLAYPKDDAIKAMIIQSDGMIKRLEAQELQEFHDRMFVEREIRVMRFRDGGSADYYLMPQNIKIASFDAFTFRPISLVTCLLSGRCVKVDDYREGRLIAQKFVEESVGIVLDKEGDFVRNIPKFKPKYIINPKKD